MGYYISNMIGVRLSGVFGGKTDMDNLKTRVVKIIAEMKAGDNAPDIKDDPSHCMSQELEAHKGSYMVIAGVFNHWGYERAAPFAAALSKEFGTEVMLMSWDEEQSTVQCNIFLGGVPLFEVAENPIGRVLRRVC